MHDKQTSSKEYSATFKMLGPILMDMQQKPAELRRTYGRIDIPTSHWMAPPCYPYGMTSSFLIRFRPTPLHGDAPVQYVLLAALLVFSDKAPAQELLTTLFQQPIPNVPWLAVLLSLVVATLFAIRFKLQLRNEAARLKQLESEAAEEKNRLNAILSNAGVGIMLADRYARHVDVNRRWCKIFGYRRSEVRGKLSIRSIAHPDESVALGEHFSALLAGEIRSHTHERRFLRKDGTVFWGLISTSTVKNAAGEHMWVVGMITDIDEQKRIEEALRESEERLRFITENTHDVVWQLDRELRFTYINGADERMRGYAREEIIGRSFKDTITPTGYPIVDQAMQRRHNQAARETGMGAESFEVEMICKDGNLLWVEINSTPIHDKSGQIVGYIGVTRDATQRHETHEKLREQTIRDPLTGLFNRRFLDESLERELSRAKRDNLPMSLLMIDIDRFKSLNDTYGHQAGDEVIRCLGELIRNGARSADLPCRYGGEEFLLVLPNMTLETAAERAQRWRIAFAQQKIGFGDISLSATFSVGVAAYPEHGDSSEALIRAADQALYTAKHSGRNRVVVAP